MANEMAKARLAPVRRHIEKQLVNRSPINAAVWGDRIERRQLALRFAHAIKEYMTWPNDHFSSDDPLLLLLFDDDDVWVSLLSEMEDLLRLPRDILGDKASDLLQSSLGVAVDLCLERKRVHLSQA